MTRKPEQAVQAANRLDEAYADLIRDEMRESEAADWVEALIADVADDPIEPITDD